MSGSSPPFHRAVRSSPPLASSRSLVSSIASSPNLLPTPHLPPPNLAPPPPNPNLPHPFQPPPPLSLPLLPPPLPPLLPPLPHKTVPSIPHLPLPIAIPPPNLPTAPTSPPPPLPPPPSPPSNPPPSSTPGRTPFVPSSPLTGSLGKISLFLAAARALETSLPPSTPPLLTDPFASTLAGDYGNALFRAIASASHVSPSTLSTRIAIRTRYFDDELMKAVTQPLSRVARYVSPSKIREGKELSLSSNFSDASDVLTQVVILSTGSDTRSLRLPLPEYVTVYEVDSEEVLAYREEVISSTIEKLGGEATLPSKARVVPVVWDVMGSRGGGVGELRGALEGVDFNPLKPTVWVCEGALWMMKETAVKALLSSLASLSASHSLLLCDWVNGETFRGGEDQRGVMEEWRGWGVRPLTGADLPEAVFAQCGWGAKVLQVGQEWEVDRGRVEEEWKRKYLKESVRGAAEDLPRDWIINANKT